MFSVHSYKDVYLVQSQVEKALNLISWCDTEVQDFLDNPVCSGMQTFPACEATSTKETPQNKVLKFGDHHQIVDVGQDSVGNNFPQ